MTEAGPAGKIFSDHESSSVWAQRTQKYGARCVINLSHPEQHYELITAQQKRMLFPLLKDSLNGNETSLLDYGCGPGRFSTDLAQLINGQVVGFDICQELLDLAPHSPAVHYTSSARELESEAYRGFFDVIWICLVLGGIQDPKCPEVADGLSRNLKSNGLIFLVEHTSETNSGSSFWRFRRFDEYKEMFPLLDLKRIGRYFDFGEEVTIMAGRKRAS